MSPFARRRSQWGRSLGWLALGLLVACHSGDLTPITRAGDAAVARDATSDASDASDATDATDGASTCPCLEAGVVGGNLIDNPGCEEPSTVGDIAGWDEVLGDNWQCGTQVSARSGSFHFYPANTGGDDGTIGELRQDIDLSAVVSLSGDDALTLAFTGFVGNWATHSTDASRVVIEYLDEAKSQPPLEAYDSGDICCIKGWQAISDTRVAPPETRFIRVRLISTHHYTSTNDGYYDDLRLVVL